MGVGVEGVWGGGRVWTDAVTESSFSFFHVGLVRQQAQRTRIWDRSGSARQLMNSVTVIPQKKKKT